MSELPLSEKWKNQLNYLDGKEATYLNQTLDNNLVQKNIRGRFYDLNKILATNAYLQNDIDEFKTRAYNCAIISVYLLQVYDDAWIYYKMQPYSMAVLSDSDFAVQLLRNIDLEKYDKPAYWNYSCKGLLINNNKLIEKAIDYLDMQIRKNKEVSLSKAHKYCIQGIVDKDITLIENGLHLFELNRNKSRLIQNDLSESYLSYHALFYGKIARRNGIEINSTYSRVPNKLLDYEPVYKYEIPYRFLAEHYIESGIEVGFNTENRKISPMDWIKSLFK